MTTWGFTAPASGVSGLPEIPDVIGTVRGYRSWVWRNGKLQSRNFVYRVDDAWEYQTASAICPAVAINDAQGVTQKVLMGQFKSMNLRLAHPKGRAPGLGCRCGLYATTDPTSSQIGNGGVFGVVECWGDVLVGAKNDVIRVQHAKITALMMPRLYFGWRAARALSAAYPGVPVYRSFRKLMRDFPPADGRHPRWRLRGWVQPVVYLLMINIRMWAFPSSWHSPLVLATQGGYSAFMMGLLWWLRRTR